MTEILGPVNSGGVQCCKRNINLLQSAFGAENVYICAITGKKEYLEKASGNICVFYSTRKKVKILKNALFNRLEYCRATEDLVAKKIVDLDCAVVFFDFSRMGKLQAHLPKHIKQVLFMHNIEADYIKNQARVHPLKFVLKRAFEINEMLAVKNADVIISLNNRDADRLNERYGCTADLIIPITFEDSFTEPILAKQPHLKELLHLLFVGSLFAPNEHGVKWFINEVMPYVNADFTVVGRDFEIVSDKLSRKNVKIIGTVDDLTDYYHNADAVVSPILFGDGMKVKTAEALMYGKPIFATDEALEGYEVAGQKNIYRCNTAEEFIEAINTYVGKTPYASFDEDIRSLFLKKYHTPSYVPIIYDIITAGEV